MWTKTRGMRDLGLLPGGTFSWAAAINDLGVVTGTADGQGTVHSSHAWGYDGPDVQCSDLVQPFIWKQQMQGLGTLGPSSDIAAISDPSTWCIYPFYGSAINDRGHVAGYTAFLPDAFQFGFLWNATEGMSLFGSSWWYTFIYGLSNTGQVVGEDVTVAAYWKDGVVTPLIGLPSDPDTMFTNVASGVNDRGQIVGWAQARDESGNAHTHAVLWSQNGAIRDLGTLPGDSESSATKLNFFGLVIGSSGNTLASPPPIGDTPDWGIQQGHRKSSVVRSFGRRTLECET
jgi:probable HAF family extracellular repeat protein